MKPWVIALHRGDRASGRHRGREPAPPVRGYVGALDPDEPINPERAAGPFETAVDGGPSLLHKCIY
jgi:hypothetical protein